MRAIHFPWVVICALLFGGHAPAANDAIAASPSPALRGETVVLKWYFAGTKIVVSGGRFGNGTVVTGRTALTDRPQRTARYLFDVWYTPGQPAPESAGQPAKAAESATKPTVPESKPPEPGVKPPNPPQAPPPSKPTFAPATGNPAVPGAAPTNSASPPATPGTTPGSPPVPAPIPAAQGTASTSPSTPAPNTSAQGAAPGAPQTSPPAQQLAKVAEPAPLAIESPAKPAGASATAAAASPQMVHVQYAVVVQVIDPDGLGLTPYNDSRGWRVHFLKGWARDNVSLPDPANNALMYFQPEEDSPERLAVAVLPVKDASSADIMKQVQADLPNHYDDCQIVTQSNLMHDSVPAVVATCLGKDRDGVRLETVVMTIVKNDHAYVVSARTTASRFAARQGLLTDMVRSFRFVSTPSAAQHGTTSPAGRPAPGRSAERP